MLKCISKELKIMKILNKLSKILKNTEKKSKTESIKTMLNAKSIAIIGASEKPQSVGFEIVKNLQNMNFDGQIFLINPKHDKILEQKCYTNITEIKKPIDLAIIAIPASSVLTVVDECNLAKVKNLVIVSAGFKEIAGAGKELEAQLMQKITDYQMTMLGPNCLGFINLENNLNATFAPVLPNRNGNVAFVSQSGALVCGFINLMHQENLACSQIVSIGNQADINFLDLFEVWENDSNVDIIMAYVEGIEDYERFKKVCSRITKSKPIIILKAGRSPKGSVATASHTGALAGDDVAIDSLLQKCGVIRTKYLRDFVNTAKVFQNCVVPEGNRLGILTNAGGPAIIATDTATDKGLNVVDLSDKTKQKLKKFLPPQASVKNPVDVIASASLSDFKNSAEVLLKSNEIDILLVIYLYIQEKNDKKLVEELEKLKIKYPNKTILGVFQTTNDFYAELGLGQFSIPIFNYGIDAITAVEKLYQRRKYTIQDLEGNYQFNVNLKSAKKILNGYKKTTKKILTTFDSLKFFECFGLPIVQYDLANSVEQAVEIAEQIGYPVVLKISSTKITHKTDVGGVVVNIQNQDQLIEEWTKLYGRLQHQNCLDGLEGIVVMQQVKHTSREFVGGVVKKDVGHMAMFGLGGIFIEVLNEVAFSPCPLNKNDAMRIFEQTKASKLLDKVRDYKAVDKQKLAETLIKMSQMVENFPEIAEIDINPIIADKEGQIIMIDARVVLQK